MVRCNALLGSRPRILDDEPRLPKRGLSARGFEAGVLDRAFAGRELRETPVLVDWEVQLLGVVLLK